MRTNIIIDDNLIQRARQLTGIKTKREVVQEALRTLQLKSEAHEYLATGSYRIVVKVIDIFGNDTSQVFEVEVA